MPSTARLSNAYTESEPDSDCDSNAITIALALALAVTFTSSDVQRATAGERVLHESCPGWFLGFVAV